MMRFQTICLVALASLVAANAWASDTYKFRCTYKGDAKADEPFYGGVFTLTITGDNATITSRGAKSDAGDEGTLSDHQGNYSHPRFYGFSNLVDCAQYGYIEVDRKMLSGDSGNLELTGQGNEDCGIEDSHYSCKSL